MKLPAIQFYPADWRKDPGVQSLDYFDRGVWFEILCLMHESPDRGKLTLNGEPMPDEALARILGLDNQTLTKTLTTLLKYGVASRDDETGALMNRRMVKDENIRKIRAEAGKKGGNPALLNQKSTTKDKQKPTTRVKQIPTPSSSSSFTSSSSEENSPHARLMGFHAKHLAGPIPDGAAQAGAIKWLLANYKPEVCEQCYSAQLKDTWRAKVSWLTVKNGIGVWLPKNGNGQRDSKPITPIGPRTADSYIESFKTGLAVAPNYDVTKDIAAITDATIREQVNQWWVKECSSRATASNL